MEIVWIILGIVTGIVLLYLLFGLFIFLFIMKSNVQSKLDPSRWDNPQIKSFCEQGLIHQQWIKEQQYPTVEIKSFDGLTLRAFIVTPEVPSNKVVIAVHGYTSRAIEEYPSIAMFYRSLGYNVLMVDDRAHGDSDGTIKGFASLDRFDVRNWIDFVVNRFGKDCIIFLHGLSMGSATVMNVTGLNPPKNVKGVIADCGFTSGYDEISYKMKHDFHLPPRLFMPAVELASKAVGKYSLKVDVRDSLKKTDIPVLFIHGDIDVLVPTYMTYENYEACASEKQLEIFEGAAHTRSHSLDPKRYEGIITEFLQKYEV